MDAERLHLLTLREVAGIDAPDVSPPAHRHVVVDGLRLHLVDWGSAGGTPIVFLHGGALTARTWDAVCLQLRAGHRCIAVDQRGHGDSEWSPSCDYDIDAHLRDFTLLIDALELDRFVLVGHSLGGITALRYAGRHSDRLGGVVVVDVTPFVRRNADVDRVRDFVQAPSEFDSLEAFVDRAVAFNPRRDPRLLRYSLRHNLRQLPDGRWTWKYDRRHLQHGWFDATIARFNSIADELSTVECPVLVVRGDQGVLSAEDANALAARLRAAQVREIAGSGHNVQGDNPKDLADAIRDFLTNA